MKFFLHISIIISANAFCQDFTHVWSGKIGGDDFDFSEKIVIDDDKNVYFTGHFEGTVDLDPGSGVHQVTSNGDEDIYIIKIDSTGNLEWALSFGDVNSDRGSSIALDGAGNLYATGYFVGQVDFDPGPGVNMLTSNGWDMYVMKISSSGIPIWTNHITGDLGDRIAHDIEIAPNGDVITVGEYAGNTDFDPATGVDMKSSFNGYSDSFVHSLTSDGDYNWVKTFGNDYSGDDAHSLVIDEFGNLIVAGWFRGEVDFDPDSTIYNLNSTTPPWDHQYILKLDSIGAFVWVKPLTISYPITKNGTAVDSENNIILAGRYSQTVDFDLGTGVYNLTSSSNSPEGFILKLDTAGQFVWVNAIGVSAFAEVKAVVTDSLDNIFVTGGFRYSGDFDPSPNDSLILSANSEDAFLGTYSPLGNLISVVRFSGSNDDYGSSIAMDGDDGIYISGDFQESLDCDPNSGVETITATGFGYSSFVIKLNQEFTVSVASIESVEAWNTYPNPSDGVVHVSTSEKYIGSQLTFLDIQGKVVFSQRLNATETTVQLDVEDGVYFCLLDDGDKVLQKKVVIN